MALESHPVVTPLGPRFIHGAVEIDQSFRANPGPTAADAADVPIESRQTGLAHCAAHGLI